MAPEVCVQVNNGQPAMVYGVIIATAPFEARNPVSQSLQRNYAPFEDRTIPRGSLEDATDDLVRTILDANPYLRAETGSAQSEVIDGAAGFSVVLSGNSPTTGMEEPVTVYTRGLTDGHVIYVLGISPGREGNTFDPVFRRMMRSLNINDQAATGEPGCLGSNLRGEGRRRRSEKRTALVRPPFALRLSPSSYHPGFDFDSGAARGPSRPRARDRGTPEYRRPPIAATAAQPHDPSCRSCTSAWPATM
jgi:hypothetical protein